MFWSSLLCRPAALKLILLCPGFSVVSQIPDLPMSMKALLGVQAVAMPGTTLGVGATLGALARTLPGSCLKPGFIHMGSPAKPLLKAAPANPEGDIPSSTAERLLVSLLPGLQLLGSWTLAVAALLPAAALAGVSVASPPSGATAVALAALITATAAFGLTWTGAVVKKLLLGRLEVASGIRKYSVQNLMRMLFWTLDMKADDIIGQAVRGSVWWNKALQSRGVCIGKRAYIDTIWAGDYELVSYGDGAIVDKNATLFAHLGMYKAGQLSMYQEAIAVGEAAVIGPRAAVLPGYSLEAGKVLDAGQLGMQMTF